tara:strand:+ start:9618 stop:9767 length:150 start_codon:yes stop_codon:yes gene_type:complete
MEKPHREAGAARVSGHALKLDELQVEDRAFCPHIEPIPLFEQTDPGHLR